MRAQHGDAWVDDLHAQVDRAEAATRAWHEGEPRIWSRIVRRIQHPFRRRETRDQPDDKGAHRAARAFGWFEGAIDTWERDERVTTDEAQDLRRELHEPQFVRVLPHFGVHLTIGVILRFPIGSITRASYTLLNLLIATMRLLVRNIDRHEWRQWFGIHSPLVILIAGMPGIGTFAYLASKPIRGNHLLLRVGLDAVLLKFPWRIYERTGLRWVIARPAHAAAATAVTDKAPVRLTVWAQSIVLVLGIIMGGLFAADIVSQTANAVLAPDMPGWEQIMRILDLGAESSLGTWFAVVGLVLLSASLTVVAFAKQHAGDRFTRHWFILALLTLAFSLDEQAKFHDPGGNTAELRDRLGLSGPIFYGWVILGMLSVIVVGLLYRRFLADLPAITRRLFVFAAALFVGGEIIFESISGWYFDAAGQQDDLIYQTIMSFEEFFGMAGVFVAIAAVLHYIQNELGDVHISLTDRSIATNGHLPLQPRQMLLTPIDRTTVAPPARVVGVAAIRADATRELDRIAADERQIAVATLHDRPLDVLQ